LKSQLESVEAERDEFKKLLLTQLGLISRQATEQANGLNPVRMRETPGQIAARIENERRRKYWDMKRQEAEAEAANGSK